MFVIGQELIVLSGDRFGYDNMIGERGTVATVDDTDGSVRLVFDNEIGGLDGWFLFSEVSPVTQTQQTVQQAVDFLISQGYTVALSKSPI